MLNQSAGSKSQWLSVPHQSGPPLPNLPVICSPNDNHAHLDSSITSVLVVPGAAEFVCCLLLFWEEAQERAEKIDSLEGDGKEKVGKRKELEGKRRKAREARRRGDGIG